MMVQGARLPAKAAKHKEQANGVGMMTQAHDVIVIGAGHNGLASARVLADRGHRVLVLEKNRYVGGMAGTREIFPGCRNEVGASCLFPIAPELLEYLQFERFGAEFIELPMMAINLAGPGHKPLMFYKNRARQLWHLLRHHGPGALAGFVKLARFISYPASVMDRFRPDNAPRSLEELLRDAPDEAHREQLRLAFSGSAMDVIDRFFPDKARHHTFRSLLAFAAIQSTYKGPYTPGSALCLVYTFAQSGDGGLMRRVKGGIGSLCEALARSVEAAGGEIRLGSQVERVLMEEGVARGVVLKNGETLRARIVLSNLDRPATFQRLVGAQHLDAGIASSVAKAEHRGAWVHMLFRLDGLPSYGGEWAWLNRDPHNRFGGAMVASPEQLQQSFESCDAGELPEWIPVAFQIPSVMDPSLAPPGQHIASAYGFCFPCKAPKSERGRLRDETAEKVIDIISSYLPDFRSRILDQAVFSSDHFAVMHGATEGDFTHGLIHPENMLGERAMVPGSAHRTPIDGLYLCGSACHPGPGVTFLPGYNCGLEVDRALRATAPGASAISR
jgi:phytoene dehydrogenase-like protein